MGQVKALILIAAMSGFLPPTSASAAMSDLEVLFVRADQNRDLVLNKADLLLTTIKQFDDIDSDKNNVLEKAEAGDLASTPAFAEADTDNDSALTLDEVMTATLINFEKADTNNDGALTIEEVTESGMTLAMVLFR